MKFKKEYTKVISMITYMDFFWTAFLVCILQMPTLEACG